MAEGNKRPQVVPAEDLAAEVASLLELAHERGAIAREVRTNTPHQRVFTQVRGKADITEVLSEELRDTLEDEVVPVIEEDDGSGLFEREVEREIQKKALVGLKASTLKRLAQSMRLDKRGKVEELADRIARAYKYDEDAIAHLVADNVDEPEPDQRYSDRLFPLAEPPNLESVARRVNWTVGRFIRVGVARWLAFTSIEREAEELTLKAVHRSYRAFVATEEEDVTLTSSPTSVGVELKLSEGSQVVRVEKAGGSVARNALKALESVSDVSLLGHLPITAEAFEGVLGTFDPNTVLMLDLVYNRLPGTGAKSPEPTVAKFRMPKTVDQTITAESEKPTLRAVKFEGTHLFDSVPACRLIAQEGRALVDLWMRVGYLIGHEEEQIRFPIRFLLDRDHLAVMTGFGRHPGFAAQLHPRLIEIAAASMEDGILHSERLSALAERIARFGEQNEPAERPTMLDQPTTAPSAEES